MNDSIEKKRPSGNRGFYVRMKIPNGARTGRSPEKKFCHGYLKWILWFSVSCCFFCTFLMTYSNPSSAIPRPAVYRSEASRVLIEESSLSAVPSGAVSTLLKDMKVYVYDLPAEFNEDWLSNGRCSSHLFASEVAIHRALMRSDARTFDPWQADFFFVPVYVSCNFSTRNGFPDIGHARPLMAAAVRHVSVQLPFWNRSLGSDHVFVASHDFGSCFHTMENAAMAEGVPHFLKNSIILQTFGVNYRHPCQEVENVVIPPYISPESLTVTLESQLPGRRRDIFAFFRGKMELHPKNVSGHFYSKKVRTMIWRRYKNDQKFYLRRQRFSGYQSEIARSTFCLCPLGWAPWSPRLVESVVLGCVPVIIADGIRLPFPSAVPWADISLMVAERDVDSLGKILAFVAETNLTAIQRNLWDPKLRDALLFRDPPVDGDATWHVLSAMSEKLGRSQKKSLVSSE